MKLAFLVVDNREAFREYEKPEPWFGRAPEAVFQGFIGLPGMEVHVISCTQQQMVSPARLSGNMLFHSLHVPKTGWLRTGYQGCIRAVRRKLREIQPDIVHGQGTERDCAISAVFSGFPNVLTIHGNMAELARLQGSRIGSYGWLSAKLENFTLPRTSGVFCNSLYTRDLVSSRQKTTWLLPNPIRLEYFGPSSRTVSREIPRILNVGVICPRKRQLEILELAAKLHAKGKRFKLCFVGLNGGGDYGDRFEKLFQIAKTQGYAGRLDFMSVERLVAEMDGSDALLHFPYEEAFGLVVAEALSRQLHFFGSRTGGIQDIAAGLSGTDLIDPGDWKGLEDRLESWLNKPIRPEAGNAVIMEGRYHPKVIAAKHLEIYRQVLSRPD